MSRRTTAANRRRRQNRSATAAASTVDATTPTRAVPPSARAGATKSATGKGRLDPVVEYAHAPGHGRTMRTSLLVGLCMIALYELGLVDGGQPSQELASIGASVVVVFYLVAVFNYFRVLYRVRRHDPESWKPGFRFLSRMLGAPIGIGDPTLTRYDRTILRLTGLAALALVVLTLLPKSGAH